MVYRMTINFKLLTLMARHNIQHIYTRNDKRTKTMPFWANPAKEANIIITSEKNLQKLGGKLMETSARIDFNEACYFIGTEQDSFVFNPTSWTEVKGAQGYVPTLTPSLIHFVRKEFKGYQGAVKEVTPKDLFFTTQLARLMEAGKTYDGFIDTSIPQAMIDMINKPENAAIIDQLLTPYINVAEVATPTLFSGLAVSEYKAGGNGGSYGSKGESESDKIKARQEAVKALVASFYGEYTIEKYKLAMGDQTFIIAMSFELGLALPSNLSLAF